MKKHLLAASSLLLSFFALPGLYAQGGVAAAEFSNPEFLPGTETTKKAAPMKPIAAPDIPQKVSKAFHYTFGEAGQADWYSMKNFYLAHFTVGDRRSMALFARNGYMQYAVKRGSEKNLPKDVRYVIKSNYVDYTIGLVNEVVVGNKTAWLVNLQNGTNFIVARVLDGGLDELSNYQTHAAARRKGRVAFPN